MQMQKTIFHVKRRYTVYDRDKTSITNDNAYRIKEFYLDQRFSMGTITGNAALHAEDGGQKN